MEGAHLPRNSAYPLLSRRLAFSATFIFALLAGGGGAEGPLQHGLIAALGALLLFSIASDQFGSRFPLPRNANLPALAALALLLIPLGQLIPLPPEVWQNLPGREYALQALQEAGVEGNWRPLSLDPEATKRAAAALLFPIALFLHSLRSSREENLFSLKLFVALAGVSGAIGALQLAAGHPAWLSFYDGSTPGVASGIFANPNHQSLMMVAAIVACGVLIRSAPRHPHRPQSGPQIHQLILWGAIFFFAIMTLAAGSRAGVMLVALGLPGGSLIALGNGSFLRWTAALLCAVTVLAIVILIYPETNSLAVRENFRIGADVRYAYLPDILYTLEQYWPNGSGLGTFADVFAPNENLDIAQRGYLNHAHNDLLEWLIETGIPGIVWLGIFATALLVGGYRLYIDKQRDLGTAAGGILILVLTAAHSLADYPLRTATIASVTALALGLFFANVKEEERRPAARRRVVPFAIALLVAVPVAAESLRLFMVQWAVREGRPAIAGQLGPSNTDVLVQRGASQLRSGRTKEAERFAALAVQAQPMNSAALRVLAMSREGQPQAAGSTWRIASSLGWRDAATQLWAFRQAMVDDEPEVAALRADALLRTSSPPPEFIKLIRQAAIDQDFAVSIASRLRSNAPWRSRFFGLLRESSQNEVAGVITVLQILSSNRDELVRSDGRSLISHLISSKSYEKAAQIDRLVAGDRSDETNFLDDGGFDRLVDEYSTNTTAFDWMIRKGRHASASVDATPPSYLHIDTDGERADLAAERYAKLPAGSYALSYRARSDEPDAFRVRLICAGRSEPLAADLTPRTQEFRPRVVEFEVDAHCQLVRLIVDALPGSGSATAQYDDFRIFRP